MKSRGRKTLILILGPFDLCGYVPSMHKSVFAHNWSSREGCGSRCKINGSYKSNMPSIFFCNFKPSLSSEVIIVVIVPSLL